MVPVSRLDPMAPVPDMPMPVPVPVSGRPHVATAMRGNMFDAQRRRRGTDDDNVRLGENRRRRAQTEEHAKRQDPERIAHSAAGLVARSRRRPECSCCVAAHEICCFHHERLLFHERDRRPAVHMEKGPERKLPLPGQVLQVLVGEDNKHPSHDARPASPILCGLAHMAKYFSGARAAAIAATTPEW
jgi:hypothetical protein